MRKRILAVFVFLTLFLSCGCGIRMTEENSLPISSSAYEISLSKQSEPGVPLQALAAYSSAASREKATLQRTSSAAVPKLETVHYDCPAFSMDIPVGWNVISEEDVSDDGIPTLSIFLRDPSNPRNMIFYLSGGHVFYMRKIDKDKTESLFSLPPAYAFVPVLSRYDAYGVLEEWASLYTASSANRPNSPQTDNYLVQCMITSHEQEGSSLESYIDSYCTAQVTIQGDPSETPYTMFYSTILVPIYQPAPLNFHLLSGYHNSGVIVESEKAEYWMQTMGECLDSLVLKEDYASSACDQSASGDYARPDIPLLCGDLIE